MKKNRKSKKTPKTDSQFKGGFSKGYRPADNRQVTHNLRRRMGR